MKKLSVTGKTGKGAPEKKPEVAAHQNMKSLKE
jgi:hypothetical protein